MNATQSADCMSIIKAFEKQLLTADSEEAIFGALTVQLSSIQVNSTAAASNLENLSNPPPIINKAPPPTDFAVNSAKFTAQQAFNSVTDPEAWQSWLAECIPCDLRLEFRVQMIDNISDELLDLLQSIIDSYLKQISFILNLLNSSDIYADICPLLFATQDICIPDIQRILSLLASMLYRMTVRELESVDLLKLLLTPLFQPLFLSIYGLLNQYKILITNPLECVIASITGQMEKIKISGVANPALIEDLTNKTDELGFTAGVAQKNNTRKALNEARQPFVDLDAGITAIQDGLGSSMFHLRRLMTTGVAEIDSLIAQLEQELQSFLGVNENETAEFLLNQYQKLLIFRLIAFLTALVKAKGLGFNCDFTDPARAENGISKFLNDFLGPNAPIIITNVDGKIELLTNPELTSPIREVIINQPAILIDLGIPDAAVVITPGDDEIFNGIINSANKPIPIKPECLFDNKDNKLSDWIKELNAQM